MLVDVLTGNSAKDFVLTDDDPALMAAYQEPKAWIFSEITDELGNMKESEILVINAHGRNGLLTGMDAKTFATELKKKGFVTCREIHLYACQTGLDVLDPFASQLSRELGNIPVWAPKGNCAYNTGEGAYRIHQVAWSDEDNEWKKTGATYDAGTGWSLSIGDDRISDAGVPKAPNPEGFAVNKVNWDINVDISQFGIEVVSTGEGV